MAREFWLNIIGESFTTVIELLPILKWIGESYCGRVFEINLPMFQNSSSFYSLNLFCSRFCLFVIQVQSLNFKGLELYRIYRIQYSCLNNYYGNNLITVMFRDCYGQSRQCNNIKTGRLLL